MYPLRTQDFGHSTVPKPKDGIGRKYWIRDAHEKPEMMDVIHLDPKKKVRKQKKILTFGKFIQRINWVRYHYLAKQS